ncbi:hypothetical protein GCM10022212_36640 [Actimicrobium antarcticum]|uniref:Phytoene synthase n=2 Tax=Actimicrobium antarcticum TaxID=1051899 RepID=A0ABP7U0D1_9BURK
MNKHAKSFSWAARFLLPGARQDAAQLYAFARFADDLADEEELGAWDHRMQQLQELEDSALNPETGSGLGQQAGAMLLAKGVSADVIRYFMASLREDANPRSIRTTEELLQFAYGVAGTVGQMMCPILGVFAKGPPYAVALGVAMQLTNIARDVVEDAARGRCYIPAQWGVSAETLRAPQNPAQVAQSFAAIRKLLLMADDFYRYSLQGLRTIPAGNRRAIRIATSLYRGIGQKILDNGAERYWLGRTSLGRLEKMTLIVACYLGMSDLSGATTRDVMSSDLQHLKLIPGFPGSD